MKDWAEGLPICNRQKGINQVRVSRPRDGVGARGYLTRQAKSPELQVSKMDICKTRQLIHRVCQDNIRMPGLEH